MDIMERLRHLPMDMPDALIVSDREGAIRFWNAAAERIFGYTQLEALGASLDIITPDNLQRRHWEGYDETMSTGHTKYGAGDLLSVPAKRKDGARISVEFSIMPMRDDQDRIEAVAAIMRDVTRSFDERKRLRKEVATLRAGPHDPG